jgi:hypothetical protein
VNLVINVGIWNIVAHIAFKFYLGASETFLTASTFALRGHVGAVRRSGATPESGPLERMVGRRCSRGRQGMRHSRRREGNMERT